MADPRVVLITGSSRGIGRALVEDRVAKGDCVIGVSRGDADPPPGSTHHRLDVTDEAAVLALFASIRREHGGLDVMINNAGVASMNHSLLTPISTVERIVSTNLVATFLFCREAAKLMKGRPGGRIVNFSTVAVRLKLAGEAAYAAAKAGVNSLTETLAFEYGPLGITVNAVGPTPIATDLLKGVPQDKIDKLVARQAIPEPAEIKDVVGVVDFFLRPESRMVTGQVIYLGGF